MGGRDLCRPVHQSNLIGESGHSGALGGQLGRLRRQLQRAGALGEFNAQEFSASSMHKVSSIALGGQLGRQLGRSWAAETSAGPFTNQI